MKKTFSIIISLKQAGGQILERLTQGATALSRDLTALGKIESFRKMKTDLRDTEKAWKDAQTRVAELGREISETDRPTKRLVAAFNQSQKSARRAKNAFEKQRLTLHNLRQELAGAKINTKGLSRAQNDLKKKTSKAARSVGVLSKALARTRATLGRAKTASRAFNKEIGKGHKAVQYFSGSMVTAFGGLGAGVLVSGLFRAGTSVQRLNRAFEAIKGSSAAAKEELDFVRKVSKDLGQEFYAAAGSYKGLAAAAKDTNLEGRESRKIFTAVMEASTALGLSADQTSGSLYAISQMISKGNVSAEELRQQLGERLPGAFQLASQAMGVSTSELNKMLERGEVLAADMLPRLADVLHKKFGQAAKDASQDATQSLNRFVTAWVDIKNRIASSGFLEVAVKYLNQMAAALKDPVVIERIKSWSEGFFRMVDGLIRVTAEYRNFILAVVGGLVAVKVISSLNTGFVGLNAALLAMGGQTIPQYIASLKYAVVSTKAFEVGVQRMKLAFKGFLPILAAFSAGWMVGKWLNQFDVVKKAGIALAGGLTTAFLRIKKAWVWLTGGDADAVQREIERTKQIFAEMFAEIGKGAEKTAHTVSGSQQEALESMAWAAQQSAVQVEKSATQMAAAVRKSTKEIKAQFTDWKVGDIQGLEKIGADLLELVETGKLTRDQLKKALQEAFADIPTDKLDELQISMQAAFGNMANEADLAGLAMEASLDAALKKLGVDVVKATTGVSEAATIARHALMAVAESGKASAEIISAAFDETLTKMKDPKEFEALKEALQGLGDASIITNQQLSDFSSKLDKAAENAGKTKKEVKDLAKAEQEAAEVLRSTCPAREQTVASVKNYSGAIGQAKSKTREYIQASKAAEGVDRDRIEQAERHARSLRIQAEAIQGTAKAELARFKVARREYNQRKQALAQAREYLRQLLLSRTASQEELQAAKARVQALSDQFEASRRNVEQQEKVARAAFKAAAAFKKEAKSAKEAADALGEVAKSGKEASSTSTITVINDAATAFRELEQMSRGAADEIRGMFDYLSQKKEIPEVDLSSLESVDAKLHELAARIVQADQTLRDRWSHLDGIHTGLGRSLNKMWQALHDQEVAALNVMQSILSEAKQVEGLRRQLEGLDMAAGNAYQTALSSVALFNDQASASAGAIINLINQSETAIDRVQYLDENQLDGLRQGIEAAKDKLVELVSQAMAAVHALAGVNRTLQDQIDREQGNLAALEQRRYEDQLRQIEELHEKAGGLDEEEYRRAVRLAEQLHQLKMQQIEERRQSEAQAETEAQARQQDNLPEVTSSAEPASVPASKTNRNSLLSSIEFPSLVPKIQAGLESLAQNLNFSLPDLNLNSPELPAGQTIKPAKVVEVRLKHDNGQSATAMVDENQVDSFLGILETAGLRA